VKLRSPFTQICLSSPAAAVRWMFTLFSFADKSTQETIALNCFAA